MCCVYTRIRLCMSMTSTGWTLVSPSFILSRMTGKNACAVALPGSYSKTGGERGREWEGRREWVQGRGEREGVGGEKRVGAGERREGGSGRGEEREGVEAGEKRERVWEGRQEGKKGTERWSDELCKVRTVMVGKTEDSEDVEEC